MKSLDRDVLLDLHRQMLLLRRFEEAAARTYREGKIPGFIHLYIGEEAIATGVCAHLQQERLHRQYAPGTRPRSGQGCAASGGDG